MRVPILVLALVATPFVASISQSKTKSHDAKKESSAKRGGDVKQQGQCNGHEGQQQGQHEDTCASVPAPTPPPPVIPPPPPAVIPPPPPPPPAPTGLAQIHGTVYNDLNGNGVMDPGEPGLAGWTVTLSGTTSGTATTGVDGTYTFLTLPVGSYTTCATPQPAFVQTAPASGPACVPGFGWSLSIPANLPDMWWVNINFGYK